LISRSFFGKLESNPKWETAPMNVSISNPAELITRLIRDLIKILKSKLGDDLVSVVLYGSYAREQPTPDSDIDLLIVADKLPESSLDRQMLMAKMLPEIESSYWRSLPSGTFPYISAILKTPREADHISRLYFDMIDEAKIFFDKDNFFESVLRKVKKRLEELGAKRIRIGKMWYWDLKPDYRPGDTFEL
jgi:predicted nucleotidyltransferase